MSIKLRHILCAGMLLALIAACGQKGPLYLPDKNGKKPVPAVPAPAQPPEKIDPEQKDDSQKPPSP